MRVPGTTGDNGLLALECEFWESRYRHLSMYVFTATRVWGMWRGKKKKE